MKDLQLQARVVVTTSNMKISRRRLADYVKKRAARAARLFPFIQPINYQGVLRVVPKKKNPTLAAAPLTVSNQPLEAVPTTKLLGVILTFDLKCSKHAEYICSKHTSVRLTDFICNLVNLSFSVFQILLVKLPMMCLK